MIHFQDDANNEMLIEIEPPSAHHSRIDKITIRQWMTANVDAAAFTRVKDWATFPHRFIALISYEKLSEEN